MSLLCFSFSKKMNFEVGGAYINTVNEQKIVIKKIFGPDEYGKVTLICKTGHRVELYPEDDRIWEEYDLNEAKVELL